MKKTTRVCLIGLWALMLCVFSDSGICQEPPELKESNSRNQLIITPGIQINYARSLFDKGDWETAAFEFKRYLHFFPKGEDRDEAEFKTGVSLFRQKKFHAAAKAFNSIIMVDADTSFSREAYFLQSDAFLRMGNTGYAQIVLQNFLKLTDDPALKDRIYFSLAQIELRLAEKGSDKALKTALDYLSQLSENARITYRADDLETLLVRARQAPKKNPAAAGIFSIIPGGGFLYCERYKDALTTFLLNAGLMFAAYEAWDDGNEALAGVIAFVETGFYSGNIYGSISAAHKYNRSQTAKILGERLVLSSAIDAENKGIEILLSYRF